MVHIPFKGVKKGFQNEKKKLEFQPFGDSFFTPGYNLISYAKIKILIFEKYDTPYCTATYFSASS